MMTTPTNTGMPGGPATWLDPYGVPDGQPEAPTAAVAAPAAVQPGNPDAAAASTADSGGPATTAALGSELSDATGPASGTQPVGDVDPGPAEPTTGPAGLGSAAGGQPGDPRPEPTTRWMRWALGALLAGTAALYLWGLSRNGWANSYYSAAAQAAGESWKAWFFGSFDAANAITVDKPPASLWVMGLSVRLFGLSYWSVLVPQALMGVASTAILYATVRRWFGPRAGLLAGLVLATTPVAALMFRFNNPDALLVLLLVAAAWAMTRATEKGSLRWIVLAGALVGFGFLAKMLQAFLVLPGFVAMYAVAAPVDWKRRIGHLFAAFAAMIAAAAWWVAIVELWPASARPYIGGSQTNSIVELIFGYNGFGRLTGEETGSVVPGGGNGPGGGAGGMWGATGWERLFTSSYGGQVAWLLPTALAMVVVLLWLSRRAGRTSLMRAATIGWGGWLLVTAAVISYSQGIIHEYYTVALAPAIGALVGIGAVSLWDRRASLSARSTMALLMAATSWWAFTLLGRSATFQPWLRAAVLIGGLAVAVALLAADRLGRRGALALAAAAVLLAVAGPAAYSLETAATPASGSLPSAGPAVAGTRGGPFGMRDGQRGPGGALGQPGAGQLPPGAAGQGGTLPAPPGMGQLPGGTSQGRAAPDGTSGQGATGGPGSLLNGSTPSAELAEALSANSGQFTWVAATTGANSAAGYQLATQLPVLAIGGFNGSDPAPTLAQFQALVEAGQVHYYIGGGVGGGGQMGGSAAAADITQWVTSNFTATTIGGTTVYDLTAPASATGADSGAASTTTA